MDKEFHNQYIDYLTEVQKLCDEDIVNEPHQLTDRLARTGSLIASIGKVTADVKRELNEAKNTLFLAKENLLFKSPPTIVQEYLKANCKDEIFLVDWCDRLGATLVHQADIMRSMLSYAKHEANLFSSGYNQNINN